MNYSRSFITLMKPDDSQKTFGKSIIEMRNNRCNIFIWASDLQKYSVYKIFFIHDKNSAIYITDLIVQNEMKAEIRYAFEYTDLKEEIENYTAIMLFDSKNNKMKFIGYRKNPFELNEKFEIIDRNSESINNLETENHESPIKAKEIRQAPEIPAEIENPKEKILAQMEDIQNNNKKAPSRYKSEKSILFEKLKLIMTNNIQMCPFEHQNRNVYWVRLNTREIDSMFFMKNFERKKIIYEQFKEYRHLILGHVKDYSGENFYFGIPFVYNRELREKFLNLGFCQFKCCDFVRPANGEYGYWLMKI